MAMTSYPWRLLPSAKLRWRPIDSFISGPENVLGEDQWRNPSPGWRWQAELYDLTINTAAKAALWEAMLLDWRMGAQLTVVPRYPGLLAPLKPGQSPTILTTHSDGTTFSDGTPYSQSSITAVLGEDLARGATEATIVYSGGARLFGGHPFGLVGEKYRQRLYGIRRYLETPANGAADGVYVVSFGSNAKEPYPAGTAVNFTDPSCVMRPRMRDGEQMWPIMERPWKSRVSVVFQETLRMSDDG